MQLKSCVQHAYQAPRITNGDPGACPARPDVGGTAATPVVPATERSGSKRVPLCTALSDAEV